MSASEFRAATLPPFVGSHVRRLPAFRRVGILERAGPGSWPIPNDGPRRIPRSEARGADSRAAPVCLQSRPASAQRRRRRAFIVYLMPPQFACPVHDRSLWKWPWRLPGAHRCGPRCALSADLCDRHELGGALRRPSHEPRRASDGPGAGSRLASHREIQAKRMKGRIYPTARAGRHAQGGCHGPSDAATKHPQGHTTMAAARIFALQWQNGFGRGTAKACERPMLENAHGVEVHSMSAKNGEKG